MKQVRFVPIEDCQLQVREPQEGEQESRTVVGMPIVYGVRSVNLTPWSEDREVYEVLEAGFITPELLQQSDVILNLNHSTKVPDVLGRYRNSERDTLSLDLVPQGMKCRCTFPHTNNANDTLELMKRGDITGMSFAFTDDPHNRESVILERTAEMSADGKEIWIRRVKRATGFYDVAIVTHPAYEQTMVGTREFGEAILREIDEQIKRECGDDDEAKRAEEEAKKKAEEEAKAKEEQEARELAEREQKEREAVAVMRMRRNRLALQNRDIETFSY
ncbi:MAG: HK97 family phage prohead protease [Prevotella sp.]|nr:HK97 family phage prohead protease [Prevotella sp.]